ncbi:hypothetical protein [Rhodovulum sulfidophilum]|uniref:hypothetical protein n=1 Tax=Rhodovulum sulfidophilum TaxID=35806 RepID=UPI00117A40A8|nr:hypothetical protein [Rhodovulum sulfidophilum]
MDVKKDSAIALKARKNANILRLHPTDQIWNYLGTIYLGFTLFFIPFLYAAGHGYTVVYIAILSFLTFISVYEHAMPSRTLHFVASLPMTLGGPIFYLAALLGVLVSGRVTPLISAVAIISGVGIISVNAIIFRKLDVEKCVSAAINSGGLTKTPRGVVVMPPWTADKFLSYGAWTKRYIVGVRAALIIAWVAGAFIQAPYMYTSVGIKERWPIALALTTFPMAFFFARVWQIPFMWYCQKNPEPLEQAAKLADAKRRREEEREQQALDKEKKRLERQRDREERRRAKART